MIPSTNSKLLVAEDWKKVYQSFKNADFKSYDFDTLRRVMIQYLRENYPEDFNDYVDSSEYIALIDLIAYLGQNLSFRIDLNARENFLETASRRDSIIQLAQLISYNPARNVPANGFLKITALSTTDNVIDANGANLANSIVGWNDFSNNNWYQQFITIINSTMPGSFTFGKPYDKATINGIPTEQYRINSGNTDVPIFGFQKSINGTNMNFEIVSSLFSNKTYIYEEAPSPGSEFSFIFTNDNKGAGSANTGFFVHFRQGNLSSTDFTITNPVANELIGINATNINNTDVWLWQKGSSSSHDTLWTKVDSTVGNNVIYNSINRGVRNVYAVTTRSNDQIDLNFADGSFGDLPKGDFRVFYRQSNGLTYSLSPENASGITVKIPYYNKNGQSNILTMTLTLQYTVINSQGSESDASIKTKAPQTYYTQNRMITGEDYNIGPITVGANILKVKSINRASSGISKYFELSDITGKYSRTNIFADDGIVYKENSQPTFNFTFTTRNELFGVLKNQIEPLLLKPNFKNFYFENYPRPNLSPLSLSWVSVNNNTNQTRGYFVNSKNTPVQVGYFSSNNTQYIAPGALIKFAAPVGQYFLPNGTLTSMRDSSTLDYVWSKVVQIIGDGANSGKGALNDGTGPIILTSTIPSTAIPVEIIPVFSTTWSYALETQILNLGQIQRNFGLSFDRSTRQWFVVVDTNLNLKDPFNLLYQGDTSNTSLDASWMIAFQWTGTSYAVFYRTLDYVFESKEQTAFYIDQTKQNYDFVTGTVIKDKITVLQNNDSPKDYSTAILTINTGTRIVNDLQYTCVSSFNIVDPGYGYVSTPTITINQPNVVNGKFIPLLTNGSISNVYVVDPGQGYLSTSTVTVTASEASYSTLPMKKSYVWQIDSAVLENDGYVEPKKVLISFYDAHNDGQIDDPDAFEKIVATTSVSEQTGYLNHFVYFQRSSDGLRYNLIDNTDQMFIAYPDEMYVDMPMDGQLYYFYNTDVVKSYSLSMKAFVFEPTYFAKPGRSGLRFQYEHNSGEERRLDPGKTNIIDIYLLSSDYDTAYRNWLKTNSGAEPIPPTSNSLEENYSSLLEPIKSVSDTLIYHPATYRVLFGPKAPASLQANFKAVKNPNRTTSDNEIRTNILQAIDDFFTIENWDFGQSFNFGELSTYVMNIMTPDIVNFVIVPANNVVFGSLFEIAARSNEIFVSGATVDNIQVIDSLTATQINTTASIVINTIGI